MTTMVMAKGPDGQALYIENRLYLQSGCRLDFEEVMNRLVKDGVKISSFKSKIVDDTDLDTAGPFPHFLVDVKFLD